MTIWKTLKTLQKNSKEELIFGVIKWRKNLKEKDKKIKEKEEVIIEKDKEIEDLKEKIKELEWKLNVNSNNSSKSPSAEWLKKTIKVCNSRKKGNKKKWGQKWHKGSNLKQIDNPDIIEELEILKCEICWADLSNIDFIKEIKRQVIDITEPKIFVKEIKGGTKICPLCQNINTTIFPDWVNALVQYWPKIKADSVYLYNHHISSYCRIEQHYKEIYWLSISDTSIINFNKKAYEKLEDFESILKNTLTQSDVLHEDETWIRMNWELHRIHVACNLLLTYYFPHKKRGKEAIDAMNILIHFSWKLITDHWSAYWMYYLFIHFFCNAHHLRELTWVTENEEKQWASKMNILLIKGKKQREEAIKKWEYCLKEDALKDIHTEYKEILKNWKIEYPETIKEKWKKWRTKKAKWLNLLERLEKNEEWTLWFIHDFNVPFDNNLAERDLRMVKARTKISWCFRSFEWVEWFCRTRSYISTIRKQKGDTYKSLLSLFEWDVLMPKF